MPDEGLQVVQGETIRLTPGPVHTDEQMDYLVNALTELWERCPVAKDKYVRLAAE